MRSYSDPSTVARLEANAKVAGFNRWFDFDCLGAGNGEVELALEMRDELTQHHGFFHGGCVTSLADTACAWAASTVAGDVVTASSTLHFLRPADGDRIRVHATVIRAGKRTVTVDGKVFSEKADEAPKLCATTLVSVAVLAR